MPAPAQPPRGHRETQTQQRQRAGLGYWGRLSSAAPFTISLITSHASQVVDDFTLLAHSCLLRALAFSCALSR